MPVTTANPVGDIKPRGGAGTGKDGALTSNTPIQILGLVPLLPCTDTECRTWAADCCYFIPAFADSSETTAFKNDFCAFMVYVPYNGTPATNTVLFSLEKIVSGAWTQVAILNNNSYGTYYNFGSLVIAQYKGYLLRWRNVLITFGEGCYRVKVRGAVSARETCQASPAYRLREFECISAHSTVRFDARYIGGQQGSIDIDGYKMNLCGIKWQDCTRLYGFFGREKSDEEKSVLVLQDGSQQKYRDKLLQKHTFSLAASPKWVLDRFKAYGTMAPELYVTDYNWNNADYSILFKRIVRDGGVSPGYFTGSRLSNVELTFKEYYESVEYTTCCPTSERPTG